MGTFELLQMGFGYVFEPTMFIMVCIAIVLGTVFGALPGVSATMAVALGLTFTYTMEPVPAIVFLTAIYCSSITGGSITAILVLFFYGMLLGEKNIVRLAIASVIIALVLYIVFSGMLSVNLPRGVGFLRDFALLLESGVAAVKGIFG